MTQERPANAVSRPVSASQAPEVPVEGSTGQDDWRAALAEEIARAMTEPADWRGGPDGDYWLMRAERVLALPALRDLLAERDKLAAQVRDGRNPHQCPRCGHWCVYDGWDHVHGDGTGIGSCALGTPTTGGGE